MTKKYIVIFSIIFIILTLIEIYIYKAIKPLITGTKYSSIYWIIYITFLSISVFSFIYLLYSSTSYYDTAPKTKFHNFVLGLSVTLFITKSLFISVLFLEDIILFFKYTYDKTTSIFNSKEHIHYPSRKKFITQIGLGLASIPFTSFLYGITSGKYNFNVKKVKLAYKNLPKSFNGFKIVQISDFHAGSFDDYNEVKRGLQMINHLDADVILFTGDLVNNLANEVTPYISIFKDLKSKYGNYSVTGNHDYGEYVPWSSTEEKEANFQTLIEQHKKMDFHLLMNENITIKKDDEKITIVGVENWGKPPFPQKGDLDLALKNVKKEDFIVLMSHDPSHWNEKVLHHPKNIELTLSGHTHGMQMGVDIPGFKWSPVKYKYAQWAGIYKNVKQYLYVNKGFGFIGFPGRIGMWPEITVIELKHNEDA